MSIDTFKRGSMEMLTLLFLCESEAYGYQITHAIKKRSDGVLTIQEGALYPLLYRLTENKYVICREEIIKTRNGRSRVRVIYSITPEGREYLKQLKSDFDTVHEKVNAIFSNSEVNIYE